MLHESPAPAGRSREGGSRRCTGSRGLHICQLRKACAPELTANRRLRHANTLGSASVPRAAGAGPRRPRSSPSRNLGGYAQGLFRASLIDSAVAKALAKGLHVAVIAGLQFLGSPRRRTAGQRPLLGERHWSLSRNLISKPRLRQVDSGLRMRIRACTCRSVPLPSLGALCSNAVLQKACKHQLRMIAPLSGGRSQCSDGLGSIHDRR